jgi:predicted O-methyltransferase YrrM
VALPKALRRLTPDRLRDNVRLRALAVGRGLIPPRTMHTDAEAELIARLAEGRRSVVEIGVYEGSSAAVIVGALGPGAVFHLIDPFTENALRPGHRGTPGATRRVVDRAAGRDGPELRWHVTESHAAAQSWSEPLDLVFIDGDHTEEGCRLDWDDWHGFVEPGGVVLFHDAREGEPGGRGLPGPTAVVNRMFRSGAPLPGWRIAAEVDSAVAVEHDAG